MEVNIFSTRFPLLIEIVLVSSDALHLVNFQIGGPSQSGGNQAYGSVGGAELYSLGRLPPDPPLVVDVPCGLVVVVGGSAGSA